MKHIKTFEIITKKNKMKKLDDIIDIEDIDLDTYGKFLAKLNQNKLYLDKGENWGEDFDIYFGPTDGKGCEDMFILKNEYMDEVLKEAGIGNYGLHAAENFHSLEFDSEKDANEAFERLAEIVKSQGFEIVNYKNSKD